MSSKATELSIKAQHDTPLGVIHPYWARKPMNIVEEIIETLTQPGDLVVDPFMGSGTMVYSSVHKNRLAAGSDISPLSHYLVDALLDIMVSGEAVLNEISRLLESHSEMTLGWFNYQGSSYIERERFNVSGKYENGSFSLQRVEVVTKEITDTGKWGKRKVWNEDDLRFLEDIYNDKFDCLSEPIDFSKVELPENSRIAIPKGAKLSHFFSMKNQASINVYLDLVEKSPLYPAHKNALLLPLSASLPMLRLSDKKASSQWPYWRPKTNLTSRNPIMVLKKKFEDIKKLAVWSKAELDKNLLQDIQLYQVPAQELTSEFLGRKAQLVITDPPYGDQVPYMEYANLWDAILGLEINENHFKKEIVRSDAPFLKDSLQTYESKLTQAFTANSSLLDNNGVLGWFYQDHNLSNWSALLKAADSSGMKFIDAIPVPKQRRSLKTVTTPQKTLDGDLLLIFSKNDTNKLVQNRVKNLRQKLTDKDAQQNFFDNYAKLIKKALQTGDIHRLADKYKNVKQAIEQE